MRPIDADSLMALVKGHGCDKCPSGALQCTFCTLNQFIAMIDSAPTLDVQPTRRGEWEICWGGVLCCTVCGKSADDLIGGLEGANYIEEPNFCPNCGADMRRVSE